MLDLLLKVLALGFASMMSPVIFALALALLASASYPLRRTFAYLGGNLVSAILITAAGLFLGGHALALPRAQVVYIDATFGVICLIFAALPWLLKQKEKKPEVAGEKKQPQLLKWLLAGFVLSITNLDAAFLYLTEVREIFQSSAAFIYKIALSAVGAAFFLMPVLLPLAVYLLMPEQANRALKPIGEKMRKYGDYIGTAVFLVFGFYLLYRAFTLQ
ncbi:MAG: GAP family protein [Candidatus Micrarchaeota archaeon]